MINKPLPFEGHNIRIPIPLPTKGRRCIHQGSILGSCRVSEINRVTGFVGKGFSLGAKVLDVAVKVEEPRGRRTFFHQAGKRASET